MNNVPMVKHVSFFESVKLRDRVVPIQKMITVPILYEGTPIGVAQISRKGETPAEAGRRLHRRGRAEGPGVLRGRRAVLLEPAPTSSRTLGLDPSRPIEARDGSPSYRRRTIRSRRRRRAARRRRACATTLKPSLRGSSSNR